MLGVVVSGHRITIDTNIDYAFVENALVFVVPNIWEGGRPPWPPTYDSPGSESDHYLPSVSTFIETSLMLVFAVAGWGWNPHHQMVWVGGGLQRDGDGAPWPLPGRPLQLLLQKIQPQNSPPSG